MDDGAAGREQAPIVRPYGFWALCLSLVVLVGVTVLGFFVGQFALQALARALPSFAHLEDLILAALDGRSDLILTAYAELASIGVLIGIARWRGGRAWRRLLAWTPWFPLRAGWRYWLTLVATIVYGLAASIVVGTFYPESHNWDQIPEHVLPTALFLILAVVMAPLAEELLFRGWIFTALRARRSAFAAIVLSAAVFAAAHNESSHLYALAVFPVGLALGWVRERTGSIGATVLVHGSYNLVLTGLGLLSGG
jgi:membrane protease YdiL (CAAX protease family)